MTLTATLIGQLGAMTRLNYVSFYTRIENSARLPIRTIVAKPPTSLITPREVWCPINICFKHYALMR